MFDSVLEQNIPRRKLGRGALISFGIHALLFGLAIYISSRPKVEEEKPRTVTFFNPAPPPPPPPPPPAGGGATRKPRTEPKKPKKPDTVVQTTKPQEIPKEAPKPSPEPEQPGGQVGGVKGGVQGGVVGGQVGGVVGGVVGGTVGGSGTEVIPFGSGMVRPTVTSPPDFRLTREAAAARISGKVLLKCVINTDGSVSDCKIMKGLPYMDQAVLTGMRSARYTPVMYQGHPQRVEIVLPFTIQGPPG